MELSSKINAIIESIEKLLPEYFKNPIDNNKNLGNVSVCIIDEKGNVYGKMFGSVKITQRNTFKIAWIKASQVWITGMKTGEYEKLVFNGEVDETVLGIDAPDLLGWPGGQPITLKDGTKLSIGFSGFRGEMDLEIVVKAISNLEY